jgi:hypothetical protein
MRTQFLAVTFGLGVSLGPVALAQEFPTTILPAGCVVQATPDAQNLCQTGDAVFDLNGVSMVSQADSSMHVAAGKMGTFGLDGPVAGLNMDDTLIALWGPDVTSTGSTAPPRE